MMDWIIDSSSMFLYFSAIHSDKRLSGKNEDKIDFVKFTLARWEKAMVEIRRLNPATDR